MEPDKGDSIKGLLLTHLPGHHGFRVYQWDPRGLEGQEHQQHQQDPHYRGNHAPPMEGKHEAQHQSGVYRSPL